MYLVPGGIGVAVSSVWPYTITEAKADLLSNGFLKTNNSDIWTQINA